jgi:uncharacterized protein YbjT (DUF2867 family)
VRVLLFGATGMVGQSVLRECLLDPGIEHVLSIARGRTGRRDPKLREFSLPDLFNLAPIESELAGFDACFFCIGVTSVGTSAEDYRRTTRDLPVSAAQTLVRRSPAMTFVFVSAAGADSSEKGRARWARVKGSAENALLAMPFRSVYVVRPALIVPLNGIRSRTEIYNRIYKVLRPLVPLLMRFAPRHIITSDRLGKALIRIARDGAPKRLIESRDLSDML